MEKILVDETNFSSGIAVEGQGVGIEKSNGDKNDSTINSYVIATLSEDSSENIDVENIDVNFETNRRRSKRKRKLTSKSQSAERFPLNAVNNSVPNTGKSSTAKKIKKSLNVIEKKVALHRKLMKCESPVRSKVNEKVAEVTAMSKSVSIGSQEVLQCQSSVHSTQSQTVAEVTAMSKLVSIGSEEVLQCQSSVHSTQSQTVAEVTAMSKLVSIGSEEVLQCQSSVHSTQSQTVADVTAISNASQSATIDLKDAKEVMNSNEQANTTANTTRSSISNYSTPEKISAEDQPVARQRKRKPKSNKNWVKLADYSSYQVALGGIDIKSWSVCSKNNNSTYFRCNKVRLHSEQCQSGLKIVLSDYDESVAVYASANAHNCDVINKSKPKLTDEIKDFIKMHFERGLKTKQIQDEFIKANMTLPAKYLIENHITKMRKEAGESTRFTVAEFKKLLDDNNKIPDDNLTAYVLQHQIDDDGQEFKFNFVISSKLLLENNLASRVCNADSTYKLIWQGYPVQVTGFTDANKKFHPSAISVSSTENEGDYTFVFNALKEGTISALDDEWKPDVIMCDAAKAISNAFRNVFGNDIVELMCWFHAKCAMKNHVSTLIPKQMQKECLEDIDKLQLSENVTVFQKASQLFVQKYCKYKDFVDYFTEQWLQLHSNWFEGAASPIKAPSCNNGLEVFNRTLKDEKTLRKKLPVQVFIKQLLKWVHTWGSRYVAGANVVYNEPVIDLPLMTKAYQWKKENKQIKKHPLGFLMVPAGKDVDLANWHKSFEWETFDEFKKNISMGWSTIVPNEKWIDGSCNCPAFLKKFMCKHVVGIAIRRRMLQVPYEAKDVQVGQKRKRGRPKLAGSALVRD